MASTPEEIDAALQQFDTSLSPDDEQRFQRWKQINAPNDSGVDYDFRGAFKAGLTQGQGGHWPDTFKKPNHPTFSDESIYAKGRPAGHWQGDTFIPPAQPSTPEQIDAQLNAIVPPTDAGPTSTPKVFFQDLYHSFAQGLARSLGEAGEGVGVFAGPVVAQAMGTKVTPAQMLRGIRRSPQYQTGQRLRETADLQEQPAPSLLNRAAGFAGEFVPVTVGGPAVIALQSAGATLESEYARRQEAGESEDAAAAGALLTAARGGVAQGAIWELLPKPLKAVIGQATGRVGEGAVRQFLAKAAGQATEGAALGATTQVAQNVVAGQPAGQDVPAAALGMAGLQAVLGGIPEGVTAARESAARLRAQPAVPADARAVQFWKSVAKQAEPPIVAQANETEEQFARRMAQGYTAASNPKGNEPNAEPNETVLPAGEPPQGQVGEAVQPAQAAQPEQTKPAAEAGAEREAAQPAAPAATDVAATPPARKIEAPQPSAVPQVELKTDADFDKHVADLVTKSWLPKNEGLKGFVELMDFVKSTGIGGNHGQIARDLELGPNTFAGKDALTLLRLAWKKSTQQPTAKIQVPQAAVREALNEQMMGRSMDLSAADLADPNNPHLKLLVQQWNRAASVSGKTPLPVGMTWADLSAAGVITATKTEQGYRVGLPGESAPVSPPVPARTPRESGKQFKSIAASMERGDLESLLYAWNDQATLAPGGDKIRFADPEAARATGSLTKGATSAGAVHGFVEWLRSPPDPNFDDEQRRLFAKAKTIAGITSSPAEAQPPISISPPVAVETGQPGEHPNGPAAPPATALEKPLEVAAPETPVEAPVSPQAQEPAPPARKPKPSRAQKIAESRKTTVVEPEAKVLKAGNVETTSDVQSAQMAKPLGTGSEFSTKVAREQKKFLLDAVDQAIGEAPELSGEITDPQLKADLARAKAGENEGRPEAWKMSREEHEKALAEWSAQKMEEFRDLFEKYKIPSDQPASEPYRDIAGGMQQHEEGFTHTFVGRVQMLQNEINRLHIASLPKVTIEVPGDGTFEIINSKSVLTNFKERAQKFPTTAPRASKPTTPRSTPTPAAPLGKPDKDSTLKALSAIVSDDPTREVIHNVWSDGKSTVATNGRMLTRIAVGVGGTEKNPSVFTTEGKAVIAKDDKQYPNWRQVVPEKQPEKIKNLDTEQLFTVLRQAQQATSDQEGEVAVRLYRNKGGGIGVASGSESMGSYEHNVESASRPFISLNPQYLIDAINAARRVGDQKVSIEYKDELSPITVRSEHAESVIMPMRMGSLPESGKGTTLKPGAAAGVEGMGELLAGSGLPGQAVRVAQALLNTRVMRELDWSRLRLELDPANAEFAGEAWVRQGLIRLSGAATEKTFPHEVFHFLWELLPERYRQAIEDARLSAVRERFGAQADVPEHLVDGTMTSDEFIGRQLPVEQYSLINPREYLSEFASNKFAEGVFANRHEGQQALLSQFAGKVRQWVKGVVNAVRRTLRLRPGMEQVYEELLSGTWRPTPESGGEFTEARQASLARTPQQLVKQETFGERGAREAVVGAYGDLAELKRREADRLQAGERARRLVRLPQQNLLTALGSSALQWDQFTLENYSEMRRRTAGSDPGLQSKVILDAWHALGYEQRRALKLQADLARQEALVRSEGFVKKVGTLLTREVEAKDAETIRQTYQLQIAQEAGDVLREIQARGKTEVQYEQLRQDLQRLEQLPQFNEAVSQRVRDMVDTLAATEGGLRVLNASGVPKAKGAEEIYRTYLDLKESTTAAVKPRAGLAGQVDAGLLNPADRDRVRQAQSAALTGDQKVFARLAAQILAANEDLRLRLATLAHFKADPQFRAQVTEVGERFRKLFQKNHNAAIEQIARTASNLRAREMTAQTAWLRLHKELVPQLEKYETLRQAVAVDRAVQASPEWRALVNRIHGDAGAVRIPDAELTAVGSGTVWNEFSGKQTLRTPAGQAYEIDLGFTKTSALKAATGMAEYLANVRTWLEDPRNEQSPDRQYWQMRYDFVDSALNVSTALSPTSTDPLLFRHGFTIPEFFFKSASLPAVKLTAQAFANFDRAWSLADQWYAGAQPVILNALTNGAKSHGYDVNEDIRSYQRDVLDRLASEYRAGHALEAGERLNNGIKLTAQDLAAFRTQGREIARLFGLQQNVGRERLMVDGLLLDEWAQNVFGLRSPQELGATAGTTLPHEFSGRARALAELVSKLPKTGGADHQAFSQLLDAEDNFTEFVQRFLAERRADYSALTPFEEQYKALADMWRQGDAQAPQDVAGVLEYLHQNTGLKYDRQAIADILLGEMRGQLEKFYREHVQPEQQQGSDARALRASKQSAFTKGFVREVGSSFYYDYGAVTAPEIRSLGMDAVNFHLVRLAKSLDASATAYREALAELENAADKRLATKQGMQAFRLGEDFRNWQDLKSELAELKYYKDTVAAAYGSQSPRDFELFSNANRLVGNTVGLALSGLKTVTDVTFGSVVKMGSIHGQMSRYYALAYARGAISTAISLAKYGAVGPLRFAGTLAKELALGGGWMQALSDATDSLYRTSKYYRDQDAFGLGTRNPVGYRVANILAMPYSHGLGYEPKLASVGAVRGLQQGWWRVMSALEAPLEFVRAVFPQMGYVVAYDAAARTAGWTIDGIAAQARRSFDYLEKTGQLKKLDLNNRLTVLPVDYILPRGLWPKGQTNLNAVRDWWSRSLDLPLNEMVLNYWKQLQATPAAERGAVSFLAADAKPGANAEAIRRLEDTRGAALMAQAVKDVHHASPENRPMVLKTNKLLKAIFPLAGWTVQSARGFLQTLGRAEVDPINGPLKVRLLQGVALMAYAATGAVAGEALKQVWDAISRLVYHESTLNKPIWNAGNPLEAAKIAVLDNTLYIPFVHDWANALLGEGLGGGQEPGLNVFSLSRLQAIAHYMRGVVDTGDVTYGLATVTKSLMPLSKVALNQLPSQQGLIAERNFRMALQLYGPQGIERGTAGGGVHLPTPLTPYRQELANAIFSGNADAREAAARAFVAKAMELGKSDEDAQRLLQQTLGSLNPYQQSLGRKLTDQERQAFLSKLSGPMARDAQNTEKNWNEAEASLGTGTAITKSEGQGGGAGGGGGGSSRGSAGTTRGAGAGGVRSLAPRRLTGRGGRSRLRFAKLRRPGHRLPLRAKGGSKGRNRLRVRKPRVAGV